jgi:hypothetical protein
MQGRGNAGQEKVTRKRSAKLVHIGKGKRGRGKAGSLAVPLSPVFSLGKDWTGQRPSYV